MRLSAHQPAYLPWIGFFDRIARSDVFVYLDSVQFEKNSYINRNLIKTAQGPLWLTVPVLAKNHLQTTILDINVDEQQPWRRKHLKSIIASYTKARNFTARYPKLEALYAQAHDNLADLCFDHLLFWLDQLAIVTPIVRASSLSVNSRKSNLVLDICLELGADHYLSGALGRNYLEIEKFAERGIEVTFQDFMHPRYEQLHGSFLPNMGIVDFWLNDGGPEYFAEGTK